MTKISKVPAKVFLVVLVPIILIVALHLKFVNDFEVAAGLFEEGNYDSYLDKMEYLDYLIKTDEDKNRMDYAVGIKYIEVGEFGTAYEIFSNINGFKDSNEWVKESLYNMGIIDIQNTNWDQAIEVFTEIQDYRDSSELLKLSKYNHAMDLIRAKDLISAVSVLETIKGYADVDEYILKCNYKIGAINLEEGNIDNSIAIFSNLGDFENSKEIVNQLIINKKLENQDTYFPTLIEIPPIPKSTEDFIQVYRYMIQNNMLKYDIVYYSDFDEEVVSENLYNAFLEVISKYVEEFSHVEFTYNTSLSINDNNNVILTVRIGESSIAKLETHLKEFRAESYKIILDMIEKGILNAEMSQRELAKALYIYVAQNLRYDDSLSVESYSGFGAVKNGLAVCNGYTALYNQLCKIVGIDVIGVHGVVNYEVDNPNHIWTYANLDGDKTYIDVTWGDPSPYDDRTYDLQYFSVDEIFLRNSRSWDSDEFTLN